MHLAILPLLSFLISSFSPAAQSSGEPNKTAEIRGVVLEATSNEPIRKALVILRKGDEAGIGTYTDDAGKFTLHAVDPGTYFISAEHSGFVADPKEQRQTVTVNAGDAGEPITVKLNRTGAISGHIVDSNGEPVVGASIQLQPLNPKKNRTTVAYGSTDDRGNYRAYNITPGKYRTSVSYSSYRADRRVKIQVEKDKAKDTSPDAYGTTYYPGTLDPSQATALQIEPGADLQGIDMEVHHIKTVRVRGKITSGDGEPPPLVMIVLASRNSGTSADVQAGSDGSFEFSAVAPGKYLLGALALLQHGQQLTANQPLEVGETDIDGVQLALGRVQNVIGAVIMPAGRKFPPGLVIVLHSREQLGQQFGNQSGGLAQIKENGSFSVENIAPGDYDLIVGNAGKGDDLYVASIRSGDQDILASGLHIGGSSPPPPLELTLKANGAQIDCAVFDEKQKPVPEARVTLLPDAPRRSQLALRAECQTNASGKCSLLGIAPGDYHIFADTRERGEDFPDPATLEGAGNMGQSVTVVEGDRKSMQLGIVQTEPRP